MEKRHTRPSGWTAGRFGTIARRNNRNSNRMAIVCHCFGLVWFGYLVLVWLLFSEAIHNPRMPGTPHCSSHRDDCIYIVLYGVAIQFATTLYTIVDSFHANINDVAARRNTTIHIHIHPSARRLRSTDVFNINNNAMMKVTKKIYRYRTVCDSNYTLMAFLALGLRAWNGETRGPGLDTDDFGLKHIFHYSPSSSLPMRPSKCDNNSA